jgi:NAD+ dependent glucose-6-phosphate dehydrogenase
MAQRNLTMPHPKTVLITGAAGNLGAKLRRHLEGRYSLRLVDLDPRGDSAIVQADLSHFDPRWADLFAGAHAVVHLAANPKAHCTWEDVVGPNLDGLMNVFLTAARAGVRRLIFSSSNHVMGGYKDQWRPGQLTTQMPPWPGATYEVGDERRSSVPYGAGKLAGERLGKCLADLYGLSVIAVRIGWVRPGDNRAEDIPAERGDWFRLMWLSNRDFCQLLERCIEADPAIRFEVINGMSNNVGMPWNLEHTRQVVGFVPQDGLRA